MPLLGDYEPSPWEPISDQVALYESSGGTEGDTLEGAPCIILWTTGRKSGKVRKTPLIRAESNGSYAVIASMGGSPTAPVWSHNIDADSLVSLQDGAELRDYSARKVEGQEKADWWAIAMKVWPHFDSYQEATTRVIPLFVLDPITSA